MRPAPLRIILYLVVLFLPFMVVATFHLKTEDAFFYNLGRGLKRER